VRLTTSPCKNKFVENLPEEAKAAVPHYDDDDDKVNVVWKAW
jgi:hypothetical protein